MFLLTASNENLQRMIDLLSNDSIDQLFSFVKNNPVILQHRITLGQFDFIYQFFVKNNLIILTAFKPFYELDFNYGETKSEIFEINKICNNYYDSDRYI